MPHLSVCEQYLCKVKEQTQHKPSPSVSALHLLKPHRQLPVAICSGSGHAAERRARPAARIQTAGGLRPSCVQIFLFRMQGEWPDAQSESGA